MKHHVTDAIQVIVAILITTSLVAVNAAPLKHKQPTQKAVSVAVVTKKPVPATPQTAPAPPPATTTAPVATPAPAPVVAAPMASAPVYGGSHEDWMAAAGIASSDYTAVDYIISHESGWNPDATEPHSGAHGLPQALPYSKTGCGWDDPVCQLKWANSYAVARYGGWWQAQAYWQSNQNW